MTNDRFCRTCGVPVAPDAHFCESCGRVTDGSEPSAPPPPPTGPGLPRGRLPVVIVAAVLMAVAAAGLIWWTGRGDGDKPVASQGSATATAQATTGGSQPLPPTAPPTQATRPPATATATVAATATAQPSPTATRQATPSPTVTRQPTPSPTATPRTPSPTPTRTATTSAVEVRPLLGDWDIRSVMVTEDGDTTDQTEDLEDTFLRLLTRNNGATVVVEIWMPFSESFELTEVTLHLVGAGRYEGTGETEDGTELKVTARLTDNNNRLDLTFVDADPRADPPDKLVFGLVRRGSGSQPPTATPLAALDLRRPETYLPASGRHFSYNESYVDGSGSSQTEAVTARIPDGPAMTRLELTPDEYEGMLTIAMHFVVRSDGVYLAYDPFPTDLQLWLARDLAAGRRWQLPPTRNGPGGVQYSVLEIGITCPLTRIRLSDCMKVRVEYVDAGYTFIQYFAPGHGEVMRTDGAGRQTLLELIAVTDIGDSTALAIVRSEAPNVAKVPR